MSGAITLEEYQRTERQIEVARARIGLLVHAVITALVSVALIVINVVVAPQFPWSPFPVVGMSIGLGFHYYGVRRVDRAIRERRQEIEAKARAEAA
jgi:hypothetical protein